MFRFRLLVVLAVVALCAGVAQADARFNLPDAGALDICTTESCDAGEADAISATIDQVAGHCHRGHYRAYYGGHPYYRGGWGRGVGVNVYRTSYYPVVVPRYPVYRTTYYGGYGGFGCW